MLSGWVEAGALGAGEEGRPLRAGKGRPRWVVPREVVYLQAHPQRGDDAGRIRVRCRGLASFRLRGGRKVWGLWRPTSATRAGRCCPRAAAPARGAKSEKRRLGRVEALDALGKPWPGVEATGISGELGLQVVPWLRGGSERAGEHGEMGLDFPYMARVVPWWASGGRAAWSGLSTGFPLHLPGLCCRADGGAFHFLTSPHHSRDFAGQSSGNVEG